MSTMRILLLGTGTPKPSLKRMGAGCLVEVGSDAILFDAGPGVFHRLLEAGIPATRVSHLFLSHLHYDHCMDYGRLVLTRWDQGHGRVPELRVFGPAPLSRMNAALFSPEGAFAPDIEARLHHPASVAVYVNRGGKPPRERPSPEIIEINAGEIFSGQGWCVRAVEVPHVQPYLVSYGFRLDCADGSFAYSGDAGRSEDFFRLAHGCDVLVHMCYQISGTSPGPEWTQGAAGHIEAAEVACAAQAKVLVVSHISSQMESPGVREKLIAEMAAIFKGRLIWAEDLMEIPLGVSASIQHEG